MKPRAADYAEIERLYKAGVPYEEIATRVGLKSSGAAFYAVFKMGLTGRLIQKAERNDAIFSEHEAGATNSQLAEKYDLRPKYIAQIVRDMRDKAKAPPAPIKLPVIRKTVEAGKISASPAAIAAALAKLQAAKLQARGVSA
jgi:hypothetical protein